MKKNRAIRLRNPFIPFHSAAHITALIICMLTTMQMMAQMSPVFYEGFSRCYDEEDENYGYTGGNDGLWGGDIATAIAIYQDAPEWDFTYCNAGYQCLKVGTAQKQGSATTPEIACEGEAVLSFRVAPWEGDSLFYLSIQGGVTADKTVYELKKHQWTDIIIHITDITSGKIRVTFTSTNKHRFFLDEVYVRPVDPTIGAIRTQEGASIDFGLLGRHYSASARTLHIEGANLKNGITASLEEGENSLFQLSSSSLPTNGGELTVTCLQGAAAGTHGCYLYLRSKDAKTNADVEKRITVMMEVANIDLEGAGTKNDPYTCADVIILADNEGTVWTGTRYWVTGFVIGGVKRYNNQESGNYDGISMTDRLALVIAADPDEKDENKYVTVQISDNARAALNVVDNPELIGRQISVNGLLLNDKANPFYLGKPGVRDVRSDAHYIRPPKGASPVDNVRGDKVQWTKILINGTIVILRGENAYSITGQRIIVP